MFSTPRLVTVRKPNLIRESLSNGQYWPHFLLPPSSKLKTTYSKVSLPSFLSTAVSYDLLYS